MTKFILLQKKNTKLFLLQKNDKSYFVTKIMTTFYFVTKLLRQNSFCLLVILFGNKRYFVTYKMGFVVT